MQGNSPKAVPQEIYLELLQSLEKVRSRLAVAIATESKATPLERLRYYRDTEERMHRCLRELRSYRQSGVKFQQGWVKALEVLKSIPAGSDYLVARHSQTLKLCQGLREALASLEQQQMKKAEAE